MSRWQMVRITEDIIVIIIFVFIIVITVIINRIVNTGKSKSCSC